jgi:hypothetical protein
MLATGLTRGVTYAVTVVSLLGDVTSVPSGPVPIVLIDPPANVRVTYASDQLTVTFDASAGATGYLAWLQAPDGSTVATGTSAAPAPGEQPPTTIGLPATGIARIESFAMIVRTLVGEAESEPSAAVPIALVDPPAGLRVSYDGTDVTATWTPIGGVTGYAADLRDVAGVVVDEQATGPAGPGQAPPATASFLAADLARDVAYTVTVLASFGAFDSVPSEAVTVTLAAPPGGAAVSFAGADITATWTGSAAATEYVVTLEDAAGDVLSQQTLTAAGPGQAPATTARFPAAGLTRNVPYTVTVATAVSTVVSRPSAPALVTLVDPPTGLALHYDGTHITATWAGRGGDTGYVVDLRDPAGAVVQFATVTQDAPGQAPATSARFDAGGLTRNVAYTVTVATQAGALASVPSAPAPITLVDPPADLTVSYDGTQIIATWTGLVGDTGYVVDLRDATGTVVRTQPLTAPGPGQPPPATALISAAGLTRNVGYTVTVTGQSGTTVSRPSSAAPITLVDPPADLQVGYDGSELTATWTAMAGVTGYIVDIRDPAGGLTRTQPVGPAAPGQPPATTTQLPASDLTRGVQYTVTVAAQVGTTVSRPSAGVPITLADPPTGLRLGYDGTSITATWTAVAGATGYIVDLRDAAGALAATQVVVATGIGQVPASAQLPAAGLSRDVPYTVTVATQAGSAVSVPSAASSIVLVDPPAGLALAFDGTSILVTWTAIPVNSYVVTLRDQGAVAYTEKIAAPRAGTAIPATGLTRRVQYSVSVTAQVGLPHRRRPPAPTHAARRAAGLALSYDGSGSKPPGTPLAAAPVPSEDLRSGGHQRANRFTRAAAPPGRVLGQWPDPRRHLHRRCQRPGGLAQLTPVTAGSHRARRPADRPDHLLHRHAGRGELDSDRRGRLLPGLPARPKRNPREHGSGHRSLERGPARGRTHPRRHLHGDGRGHLRPDHLTAVRRRARRADRSADRAHAGLRRDLDNRDMGRRGGRDRLFGQAGQPHGYPSGAEPARDHHQGAVPRRRSASRHPHDGERGNDRRIGQLPALRLGADHPGRPAGQHHRLLYRRAAEGRLGGGQRRHVLSGPGTRSGRACDRHPHDHSQFDHLWRRRDRARRRIPHPRGLRRDGDRTVLRAGDCHPEQLHLPVPGHIAGR